VGSAIWRPEGADRVQIQLHLLQLPEWMSAGESRCLSIRQVVG
jgi:hypothetical protein